MKIKSISSSCLVVSLIYSSAWSASFKELNALSEMAETIPRWQRSIPFSKMHEDGLKAFQEMQTLTEKLPEKNWYSVEFGPKSVRGLLSVNENGKSGTGHMLRGGEDGSIVRTAFKLPVAKLIPKDYSVWHQQAEGLGIQREFELRDGIHTSTQIFNVKVVGGTPMRAQFSEEISKKNSWGSEVFKGSVTEIKGKLYINGTNRAVDGLPKGHVGSKIELPSNEKGTIVGLLLSDDGKNLAVRVARDKNTIIEYSYNLRPSTREEIASEPLHRNLTAELRGFRPLSKEEILQGEYLAEMKVFRGRRSASEAKIDHSLKGFNRLVQ